MKIKKKFYTGPLMENSWNFEIFAKLQLKLKRFLLKCKILNVFASTCIVRILTRN